MDFLNTARRKLLLLSLLLALPLSSPAVLGQDDSSSRAQRMKAASIYKFTRYILWPDSAAELDAEVSTTICLLGTDPYDGALQALQNSTDINVRQVDNSDQMDGCHFLVISESEQAGLEKVLRELRGKSVVTISEIDHFIDRGGIIRLYARNNRVRFDINQRAARDSQLHFDPRLTRLAATVLR